MYTCQVCDATFSRGRNLVVHTRAVHDPTGRFHACSVEGCNRRYSRRHDLLRRMQRQHPASDQNTDDETGA
ncbi:hypothetical protein C8Q76DRAFT_725100 [Earliella scabrosa]|nr:hypothetical protein C8Q76DRAFT_725100 [Earliella scabrosa]